MLFSVDLSEIQDHQINVSIGAKRYGIYLYGQDQYSEYTITITNRTDHHRQIEWLAPIKWSIGALSTLPPQKECVCTTTWNGNYFECSYTIDWATMRSERTQESKPMRAAKRD